MILIGLTGVFLIASFIDLPLLLQKSGKRLRTMLIYAVLMLMAYSIAFLQLIDKAPPSPSVITEKVIKFLLGLS